MATTKDPSVRTLIFLALFVVPVAGTFAGGWYHLERSKRTDFCLSCHTMSEHGRSLFVDDPSFLPAAHYQNNRVPRDQACYTCHTDYTIYGGVTAKLRGLRHVYVQYVKGPPEAADLKLYRSYNNRECLHCHGGSRAFEEKSSHNRDPKMLEMIKTNQTSCMNDGCHDIVHNIDLLKDATFWKPDSK